jgi:hypothetical protein
MRNMLLAAVVVFRYSDWKLKTDINRKGRKSETCGKDAQRFQISGLLLASASKLELSFLW